MNPACLQLDKLTFTGRLRKHSQKKKHKKTVACSFKAAFFVFALPQDKLEKFKMNIALAQENHDEVGFLTACAAGE